MIDWTKRDCKITPHFTVGDAIWLPSWGRLANDKDGLTDEIKSNLVKLCEKMELVRKFLGDKPIFVHCMFRSPEYNKLIGGAKQSAHLEGLAIDFHCGNDSDNAGCDTTRTALMPKLLEWDLRMEDNSRLSKRNWVHIDMRPPNPNRYFKI